MKNVYSYKNKWLYFLFGVLMPFTTVFSQTIDKKSEAKKDKYAPMKLKLNEDGSKYLRFLFWTQVQAGITNLGKDGAKPLYNLRRIRMAAFGQFSPKFLYFLHVGTHSYNAQNATLGGKGGSGSTPGAEVFINGAWGEYMALDKKLYIGAGIHYWGAISRLQRQSTFKFLTMDNQNTRTWLDYARTGSFVREFGVYAKGTIGKFHYNVSINDALNIYGDATDVTALSTTVSKYSGATIYDHFAEGGARFNYTARLEYQFWDSESDKLPFKTGSVLSKKSNILNVGAGLWLQPNAAVKLKSGATIKTVSDAKSLATFDLVKQQVSFENATHFAVDAFLDKKGITAYALLLSTDYGTNAGGYRFTGLNTILNLGYLITDDRKINLQPYVGLNLLNSTGSAGVSNRSGNDIILGINFLHLKHSLKTTLEYQRNTVLGSSDATNKLVLQLQFFI